MKILNRQQFLAIDKDVLFSKYAPCWFENPCIKHQSLDSNDYVEQALVDAIDCTDGADYTTQLFDSEQNGTSIKFNFDCAGRDGCFDDDQLFAVWEDDDVKALIAKLSTLISI